MNRKTDWADEIRMKERRVAFWEAHHRLMQDRLSEDEETVQGQHREIESDDSWDFLGSSYCR